MKGTAHGEFLRAAPEELRLTRYEIQGKASSPFASEADCRAMVRSLLADRFKLAFHWEDREADIFYLVVAPGGLKLQKALPSDEGTDVRFVVNGITTITFPPIVDPVERAQTKGMTMSELAARLPIDSLLPIVDDTGLTERYKIDLRYSTVLSTDSLDGPNDPLIGAALAKVGLRVEKRRGIAKVRVLDHIEEPDAN